MKVKYTIEIEEVKYCCQCPFNYDGYGCSITGKAFTFDEDDEDEDDIPKDCPLQTER